MYCHAATNGTHMSTCLRVFNLQVYISTCLHVYVMIYKAHDMYCNAAVNETDSDKGWEECLGLFGGRTICHVVKQ